MKSARDNLLSFHGDSGFLKYRQFYLERDILRIAFHLFEAEKRLKISGQLGRISIPMSLQTAEQIDIGRLRDVLKELILLILVENADIRIKRVDDVEARAGKELTFPREDAIILFSGGVDSFSGTRIAEREYKNLCGVFVAHNDQPRIISIVNSMKHFMKTEIRTIYAPGMGSTGYSQLRGFLYVLSAGVHANLFKAHKILVTECGPTMYQPLFSIYDSITYTTHPYVLKAAKEVLGILLGADVDIVLPFEDLTKAEVISNSGIKDFGMTHSCISQRFGDHDGTCFGCVIRRLASLVSNVRDVEYKKNVFRDDANLDNLLAVLAFSNEVLHHPDDMLAYQTEKIEEFGKRDLFERYALDNLAGLMLGTDKKNTLRNRFVSDERILQERIINVRRNAIKPDFKKAVD